MGVEDGGFRPLSAAPVSRKQDEHASLGKKPFRALVRFLAASPVVDAVASAGDQFLLSGVMFVMTILLGKACGRSVFTAFGITKTLLILLDSLRRSLVELPVMVFVPAQPAPQRPATFGAAAILQLLLALVFLALTVAGTAVLFFVGEPTYLVAAVASLAGASLLIAGREFTRSALYSLHRPRTALVLNGASRVLLAAGAISLYARGLLSPVTAWLLVAAADVLVVTAGWRLIPFCFAEGLKRVQQIGTAFWRFGRWMAGSYSMMWLARTFPVWALVVLRGPDAAAGVFAALSVTSPLVLVGTPFSNVFVARGSQVLSEGGPRALARYLAPRRLALILVVGATVVPLCAFARPLLHLLYGGKYDDADWIIRFLAVQVFLLGITRTLSIGLVCMRRARLHFVVHAACGLTALAGFYPLIKLFGTLGCVGLLVGVEVLYSSLFLVAYRMALHQASDEGMVEMHAPSDAGHGH